MKELQRRLDQTLGKPGSYHHGMDREGHIKPMTIGARLYRLENQVNIFSLVSLPFFEIFRKCFFLGLEKMYLSICNANITVFQAYDFD